MSPRHLLSARRALTALLLVQGAAPTLAQGPFQPGLRWIDGASLSTPWIPTQVEFAAGDNLVWLGAGVGADRLLAYDTPGSGVAVPARGDLVLGAGVDLVDVAAGARADRLFALTQREAPTIFQRRTEVTRRDLLAASVGASFTPVWTHDLGLVANGPARFRSSADAQVVVAAAWDDAQLMARVDWLDGASGALLARTDLAATSLGDLVLSADGARCALALGPRLVVLASDGSVLLDQAGAPAPEALALDADGSHLVVGAIGEARVLADTGTGYALHDSVSAPLDEVASEVGVSPDGETWAIAWWRFQTRDLLRHEVRDGLTGAQVLMRGWSGAPGGLQNTPVGVCLSGDGQRVAFASWGKGDSDPEVVLYDVPSAAAVLEVDLPGSALALDLDASGTRLVVATKSLHANLVSSTGEVRLYDTGERDLTLLGPTLRGGLLEATAQEAGASHALYLVGARAAQGASIPGALGELGLTRAGRIYVYSRPSDAAGVSSLTLPLPTTVALVGAPYALQVAHRVNGQLVFSEEVLDLLFH